MSNRQVTTEETLILRNTTLGNASTGKHGLLPLLPGTSTEYLDGTGNFSTPAGSGSGFVTPNDSTFSWTNQGGATTTTNPNGSVSLQAPNVTGNDDFRIRRLLLPSAPYTVTANITQAGWISGAAAAGLALLNSGSGKCIFLASQTSGNASSVTEMQLAVRKYTNPTTYNSDYVLSAVGPNTLSWFRWKDDGTTRYAQISLDGVNWVTLYSVDNTDYITPDTVGWFVNNYGGGNIQIPYIANLNSWQITTP